ncbi:hypothetical protein ACUHMQ_05710 [Chitinimonas sp. PSY-7]|uniref:hypothetical protein n=1 Tax=Chitinimonas sp. PSY-7 TaxID=3459088 RepID=UPI00403FF17B
MSIKDLFSRKAPPTTAATPTSSNGAQANAGAPAKPASPAATSQKAATPSPPSQTPPSASPLRDMTEKMTTPTPTPATDALNSQIVQAVQFSNSETAAYASNQVAIAPNMMITQAGGLVAQSAANYFDGASKLALASKSVLLKDMTAKFAKEDLKGAAEDALGVLITDLLMGTAAAVAAAAGAIEAESAHFALDKIDQSIEKYQALLDKKSGTP